MHIIVFKSMFSGLYSSSLADTIFETQQKMSSFGFGEVKVQVFSNIDGSGELNTIVWQRVAGSVQMPV